MKSFFKNTALFSLLTFLVMGCTCRELTDQELGEFQRTIIPFTANTELVYENQFGAVFTALASKKINSTFRYDQTESCGKADAEIEQTNISFDHLPTDFIISVRAADAEFDIEYDRFFRPVSEQIGPLEDIRTDLIVDGIGFMNVFKLEDLSDLSDTIEFILYSIENGIEFIKFKNSTYLKLIIP